MPESTKLVSYTITCNDLRVRNFYYGSTTNFTQRKNCHKSDCTNVYSKNYNRKIYKFIRENGGWENWSMVVGDNDAWKTVTIEEALHRKYWGNLLCRTHRNWVPQRMSQKCDFRKKGDFRPTI